MESSSHPNTLSLNFSPAALVTYHGGAVVKFLLFCILFVLCWPVAILALVLYPLLWLVLLPFRIVGIAVGGVLELVWALITLPARLIRGLTRA
jgi:hypothetical protein